MLKTILSVSGKPGLFKLISNGKNMVIVESLTDKRRLPIYARDKVVSLGDIAMYTTEDEIPLADVLLAVETKENGGQASIKSSAKPEELRAYFAEILPDYDRERVYDSDIKKLITWYNMLIDNGYSFKKEEEAVEETNNTEEQAGHEPTSAETKEETPEVAEDQPAKKKGKSKAKEE